MSTTNPNRAKYKTINANAEGCYIKIKVLKIFMQFTRPALIVSRHFFFAAFQSPLQAVRLRMRGKCGFDP